MDKRLAAGVAGLFALTASAASAATTSCGTVAACIFGSNSFGVGMEGDSKAGGFGVSGVSSSGHGVNGTSVTSFGVVGITTQNATSTGTARAGVLGQDSSTNKKAFNSGVAGTSTYGIGVTGTGGAYGGYFTSKTGKGLYADKAQIGTVYFSNSNDIFPLPNPDIYASSSATTILGKTDGLVVAPSNGIAPTSGAGNPDHAAIRAYGNAYNSNYDLLFDGQGCFGSSNTNGAGCSDVVTIDAYGDAAFAGSVTQNSSTLVRMRSSTGTDVASYGARTSSPTLEDFGKASLVNGVAYVPIESVFASTIDPAAGYMVFLTPEGNSHGLYTAQLTSRGFAVHENDGGKSSLTFDYRIVAHPADTKNARLAVMPHVDRRSVSRERWRQGP